MRLTIALLFLTTLNTYAGSVSIQMENDILYDSDSEYTHGTRIVWQSDYAPSHKAVSWMSDKIPFIASKESEYQWGLSLGQNLNTPEDISIPAYIPGDRRYSAWLYGGIFFREDAKDHCDYLELDIGVVGPLAQGEEVQTWVHKEYGATTPMGWDNQIDNEFALQATCRRSWKYSYLNNSFQAIPHVGVALGNVAINTSGGATLRLGWYLPEDYGPVVITPSGVVDVPVFPVKSWSFYLFSGADVRAVYRNMFLDGNSFRNNGGVDKEWLVNDTYWGAFLGLDSWSLKWAYTYRSKEFEGVGGQKFGSLSLSYLF